MKFVDRNETVTENPKEASYVILTVEDIIAILLVGRYANAETANTLDPLVQRDAFMPDTYCRIYSDEALIVKSILDNKAKLDAMFSPVTPTYSLVMDGNRAVMVKG